MVTVSCACATPSKAKTAMSDNNIPSTDFFPATPFSVFNGEAVGGTWRLRVSDNAAGDTSNANWNATLTFVTADAVGTPEPSTLLTVGLAGGALLVGLVRRRMHR